MNINKGNVTIVIDGQYGSCGKGAICGHMAQEFDIAVRVGAPNAGHTLKIGDNVWKMQQIPVAGIINENIFLCIGAGGLISEDILRRELKYIPHYGGRLLIDRNAGILEPCHKKQEEDEKMFEGIGSTCEGVGAARRDKIKRNKSFRTAKDIPWLGQYISNVADFLNNSYDQNKHIMIEGTQGFGLSMNHGDYPYTTSTDVLASSLLSDCGLSPHLNIETILVVRTYPIRVFGNSGPMCGRELTWEEVTKRSGYPFPLEEKTTVTKRVRRICEFDFDLVKTACRLNRPTQIALTFMDYINHNDFGKRSFDDLSLESKAFIRKVEARLDIPVTLIKTGPDNAHIIDRRG